MAQQSAPPDALNAAAELGCSPKTMTLDEKVGQLIEAEDHLAYQLLFDDRRDWRETSEEFENALQVFRDKFEELVSYGEIRLTIIHRARILAELI